MTEEVKYASGGAVESLVCRQWDREDLLNLREESECSFGLILFSTEKKVSAVSISDNGQFFCQQRRISVELDESFENQALVQKKGSPLLSHYCSIITSLVSCWMSFLTCQVYSFYL